LSGPGNLRQFLQTLRKAGEIVDIHHEVDAHLEIAEIHRRVAAAEGPALYFHRVKGSLFPVVTNLFGSDQRIALAFPHRPEEIIAKLIHLFTKKMPPPLKDLWSAKKELKYLAALGTKKRGRAPITECLRTPPQLGQLPLLKSWPLDGGAFITLPLVYTEAPQEGAPNLGIYRIQRYDEARCGLHFQIQKGGGFHYHQAESLNRDLPVTIFIGGPPALMLSAVAPLPENVSELLLCGLLLGQKLSVTKTGSHPHPLIAECEFALLGKAPAHQRRPEGPFGDHYGYYSLQHDFPIFECQALYHRKDAIYPATVVGKPKQEDFYIGNYLQKLLSPLFPIVMPGVADLWSYGETGFHSLSAAIVKERYHRECMLSAFRILGEGQLALTKFLLLTDQHLPLQNFKRLLQTILERFRPETDLFIFSNLSLDTLDYTGPALNKGSRGVLLGIGEKIRTLPTHYAAGTPQGVKEIGVYIPGCLVLEAEKEISIPNLLPFEGFQKWPLIILVDSVKKTLKNETSFLWTVFTRFEPAADIWSRSNPFRNHLVHTTPLLIDARMKPSYPQELQCDPVTAETVTRNWPNYFPQGMAMGSSDKAHAS
jgi:4-hydroxybenzoate decarboxylase subunit C